MARVLGHRRTKEAATDNPNLRSPRHIPTLPIDFKEVDPTALVSSQYIGSSNVMSALFDARGDATYCQLGRRETDVDNFN